MIVFIKEPSQMSDELMQEFERLRPVIQETVTSVVSYVVDACNGVLRGSTADLEFFPLLSKREAKQLLQQINQMSHMKSNRLYRDVTIENGYAVIDRFLEATARVRHDLNQFKYIPKDDCVKFIEVCQDLINYFDDNLMCANF